MVALNLKKQSGLTLVEVVLALAIILTASQIVILSANIIPNKAFIKAVDLLAEELRYIQRMAIVNGKYYSIKFVLGENDIYIKKYYIYEGRAFAFEDNEANYKYKTVILPEGVVISNIRMSDSSNTFIYNPRGTVSSGGTIQLDYKDKSNNKTKTKYIFIGIGAGRVRIE